MKKLSLVVKPVKHIKWKIFVYMPENELLSWKTFLYKNFIPESFGVTSKT
jgi:hypothetical protein